jgi:C-terminal processing protease CtpA/Prc
MHALSFLEAEGLLYIQYNQCATSPEQDLDRFTNECADLCATGRVRSIVFDLQYNGGGNSLLGDGMFEKLAAHPPMKEKRNVFCVIGRGTFSSAILNAKTLQSRYGATLVGEPTGGSPNHFGEVRTLRLPNSKLEIWYSTKRFERGPPGATTIEPDLRAEAAFADWVEGRDPVLDAIRAAIR